MKYGYDDVMKCVRIEGYDMDLYKDEMDEILEEYEDRETFWGDADLQTIVCMWCEEHYYEHEKREEAEYHHRMVVEPAIEKKFI